MEDFSLQFTFDYLCWLTAGKVDRYSKIAGDTEISLASESIKFFSSRKKLITF